MKNLKQEHIKRIADLIIPPGENAESGASESRVVKYIYESLKQEDHRELNDYFSHLSELSELSEPVLRHEEEKDPEGFGRLIELVYEAYYGDPEIVKRLELPGPPQPGGYEMKPFDPELLKQVRQRKK